MFLTVAYVMLFPSGLSARRVDGLSGLAAICRPRSRQGGDLHGLWSSARLMPRREQGAWDCGDFTGRNGRWGTLCQYPPCKNYLGGMPPIRS